MQVSEIVLYLLLGNLQGLIESSVEVPDLVEYRGGVRGWLWWWG